MRSARHLVLATLAALGAIGLGACGSSSSSTSTSTSTSTATSTAAASSSSPMTPGVIKRTPLAEASNLTGVPGKTLGLSKVVIAPHSALALHRHPGTQVAYIDAGKLSYTVRDGSVEVMAGVPGVNQSVVRRIGPGQTGTISAGEWIVERPTVVHFGANKTNFPVIIFLATLFKTGSPASIPGK